MRVDCNQDKQIFQVKNTFIKTIKYEMLKKTMNTIMCVYSCK